MILGEDIMVNDVEIGAKIAKLRIQKGYSQSQFAKTLHVSQPTLCRWEKGTTSISIEALNNICDLLGISVTEILSDNTPKANLHNPQKALYALFISIIILLSSTVIYLLVRLG